MCFLLGGGIHQSSSTGGGPGIPPLTPSLSTIPTPHKILLAVYMTEGTLNLAANQSTTSNHQSLAPSSTPMKKTANLIARKSHCPQPINIDRDEFELMTDIHHPTSGNEFSCFQELAHVFQWMVSRKWSAAMEASLSPPLQAVISSTLPLGWQIHMGNTWHYTSGMMFILNSGKSDYSHRPISPYFVHMKTESMRLCVHLSVWMKEV